MNIAYTCIYKALDINSWSGTSYHIAKALESKGFNLTYIEELDPGINFDINMKHRLLKRFSNKNYMYSRDPLYLKRIGKEINKQIKNYNIDLIFTPGLRILGELHTDIPTAFFSDATFAGMIDYYPDFSNCSKDTLKNGYRMEKHALEVCSAAIFSSKWAAESAINTYNVNPDKVHIVNFGSNMRYEPDENEVKKYISSKNKNKVILIFIGVDWKRKGGDTVLKVLNTLNNKNIPAELHIIGSKPEDVNSLPSNVILEGFLNKNNPGDFKKLISIIKDAHFLILPTLNECYGIVTNEVNSFGVPSLITNTGGTSSVIKEGVNGHMFAPYDIDSYCSKISEYFEERNKYENFAFNSYKYYKENLSWDVAAEKLHIILNNLKNNL